MAKKSWWTDWGDTFEVEDCVSPFPPLPIIPVPEPDPTDGGGLQPRISDFMIFPTNIVEVYYVVYGS
jgi:hypothetical protein